jgi:hypothetical protein
MVIAMKKIILFLTIVFISSSFAQTAEDLIKMIDVKLKNDKKYLQVYSLPLELDKNKDKDILVLPRTNRRDPFKFKFGDEYQYRLIILKDGIELDSLQLLYIEEIKLNSLATEGLFESVTPPSDDTTLVINFADMYNLKKNHRPLYNKLYDKAETYILRNEDTPLETLLKINPDTKIRKSFGFSSRDMTDYLRFMRFNTPAHWYPKEKKNTKTRGRNVGAKETSFHLDASIYSLSFSHKFMRFGIGGASLELDVEEPLMNMLPLQSMLFNGGFRTIFMLGDKNTPKKNTYIDAKFQVRYFLSKTLPFDGEWQFNNFPIIFADDVRLNTTTGMLADLNVTRPFTLPFMRLYFTISSDDFSSPNVVLNGNPDINNGGAYAYFTQNQFLYTMSFFWNGDERMQNMFKMDIGIGYYDVYLVEYGGGLTIKDTRMVFDKIQPYVKLYYTFAPSDIPLFNVNVKVYDSQATIGGWFRLFRTKDGVHSIRFDMQYITAPIGRDLRDWEINGGLALNLRYRYGL